MKTFKAKPVIVPSDLAERFDKATGQPEGYLRNLIADKGSLHQLEEELLGIGIMSMVKGLMEDKNLPDDTKPLSRERLANVIYVIMFAYCTGTMHVDDDGDVSFGTNIGDIKASLELAISDRIKFANGKTMPTEEFMGKLRAIASPDSIGATYDRVVTRKGLSKTVEPQSAFRIAVVSIVASKDLMEGK